MPDRGPLTADPDLAWTEGLSYSQAVRVGDLVFTAGQAGYGPDGAVVDGFEAQLRQALANLEAALEAAGATLDAVGKLTVYLRDASDYDTFKRVRVDTFRAPFPASTAVVTDLLDPAMLVELDAMAVAGGARTPA
jgi:2-iminobutanoate/2-iminopropanoate deaminase